MVPCRGKDHSPTTSVSSFHHPFEFDPPSPSRSHLSSPPPTSQNRLDLPPIPLPLPPLVDQTTYDPLRQMTQFLGPDHLTQDDASDPSAPDTSVTTPNEEVEFDNETQLQSGYRIPGELPKDNVELELAIMDHGHLPATTITNPDDGTDGVFMSTGQDRFLNILKSDQVSEENHLNGLAGYEVFWDEREPGDLIAVLENCGPRPTLLDNRRAEDARHFQRGAQISARKPFDPKAPHFDIVIISLPNSQYFPQMREAVRRLSPNPMDRLPLESLLGRPGFVILHVGNTPAGLAEGLRLFSVWSVKRLEV